MINLEHLSLVKWRLLLVAVIVLGIGLHVPSSLLLDPIAPMDLMYAHPPWNQYIPQGVTIGNYTPSDQMDFHQPLLKYLSDSVRSGEIPAYTNLLGNGTPLFFNAIHYASNPIIMSLSVLLGPEYGYTLYLYIMLAIGSLSAAWLCDSYGVTRVGTLWCVIVLVFSTTGLTALGIPMSDQMHFTLLAMASVRALLLSPTLYRAIFLAVPLYLVVTSAYAPGTIAAVILLGAYTIFEFSSYLRRTFDPIRPAVLFVVSGVLAVALALPHLIETLNFFLGSGDEGVDQRSGIYGAIALKPAGALTSVLPHLFGFPPGASGPGGMLWFYDANYIGLAPLVLILPSIFAARQGGARLFFVVASAVYMFSMYNLGDVYLNLTKDLPLISGIRAYTHIYMALISVSFATAFGLDYFLSDKLTVRKFWASLAVALIIIAAVALRAIDVQEFVDTDAMRSVAITFFLGFLGLLCLLASAKLFSTKTARGNTDGFDGKLSFSMVLALGFTLCSLLFASDGVNRTVPKSTYYPAIPELDFLAEQQADGKVLPLERSILSMGHLPYEIRSLGYTGFYPYRTRRIFSAINADFPMNVYTMQFVHQPGSRIDITHPFVRGMGVKFITTHAGADLPQPPSQNMQSGSFDLVQDGAIRVYEDTGFSGRAFVPTTCIEAAGDDAFELIEAERMDLTRVVVKDSCERRNIGGGEAQIVAETSGEIIIEAELSQPGVIVVGDSYAPGFTSTVNGSKAEVHQVNYNFLGVDVPAGASTVVLRYKPSWLMPAVLLSTLTWLAVISLLIFAFLSRRYRAVRRLESSIVDSDTADSGVLVKASSRALK